MPVADLPLGDTNAEWRAVGESTVAMPVAIDHKDST